MKQRLFYERRRLLGEGEGGEGVLGEGEGGEGFLGEGEGGEGTVRKLRHL